jgi:hypothetical protein
MKKSVKTILFITITLLLASSSIVYGQKESIKDVGFYKNAIHGNVGIGGLYLTATGYYERMITQNSKVLSFVKVGFGGYSTWGDEGNYILGQFGILLGANKHHLELGAGPRYVINGGIQGYLPFTATIGWRIQKPGGKFIFRMGVSWPEAVYIGLGFSF